MRILITNHALRGHTGTEMYVLDVARRLQALGHMVVAYSTDLGLAAEEIRSAGIPVVSDLSKLPFQPDIIHGHHHMDTMTALLCLPAVPAVFFCHGAIPWQERAPMFPRIYRYIAVDHPCFERMVCEQGIPEEKIVTQLNFADLERFQPRPPLPVKPQRALIYGSGNASQEKIIRAACASAGIELATAGNRANNVTSQPEKILPHYDIVFAKARSAIESMAVGCAVIVFDGKGCGPLVTTRNFPQLRPLNFGYRAASHAITAEFIASQLAQYDATDATAVSQQIRAEADLRQTVDNFVRLYAEVIDEHARTAADPAKESHAAGMYFQSLLPVLKRAPRGGVTSKYRLLEKLAKKTDKISTWLRS